MRRFLKIMNNRFVNIIRKIPNSNYSLFGKYKKNFIQELIYAQVFHDSIKGCDWLDDSKFAIADKSMDVKVQSTQSTSGGTSSGTSSSTKLS